MKRLPGMIFVVDVGREVAAVHEANLLNIPIVALVDTNCNPQPIDYVIPSNDDAIRAIKLLVARVADAVLEGKSMRKEEEPMEAAPASTEPAAAKEARPAKAPRSRKGQRVVEAANVDEVGEVDLLGESTLAKLNVTRRPADVADAVMGEPKTQPRPAAPVAEPAAVTPAAKPEESTTTPTAEAGE